VYNQQMLPFYLFYNIIRSYSSFFIVRKCYKQLYIKQAKSSKKSAIKIKKNTNVHH